MKNTETISLPLQVIHSSELVDKYGDIICDLEPDVNPTPIVNAINNFDKVVELFKNTLSEYGDTGDIDINRISYILKKLECAE